MLAQVAYVTHTMLFSLDKKTELTVITHVL